MYIYMYMYVYMYYEGSRDDNIMGISLSFAVKLIQSELLCKYNVFEPLVHIMRYMHVYTMYVMYVYM